MNTNVLRKFSQMTKKFSKVEVPSQIISQLSTAIRELNLGNYSINSISESDEIDLSKYNNTESIMLTALGDYGYLYEVKGGIRYPPKLVISIRRTDRYDNYLIEFK